MTKQQNQDGHLKKIKNRFAFLRWPLSSLHERVVATREVGLVNKRAVDKRYPLRAFRYWWVRCVLLEEIKTHDQTMVIADAGCNRGHIKHFVGDLDNAFWMGLDWKIDSELLRKCGYSELHECDFDKPLDLPDNSVDVIVFLHVIEHVPRPECTISELARILRPGGVLLAGSPVAPGLIAVIREWMLRSRLRSGKIKPGKHINAMTCSRWRRILKNNGLQLEIFTGAFFVRWSQSFLENYAWWARLNQIWGALFPSLGGEVYLSARKDT